MGTKKDPGAFDCYNKAMTDEPRFTLIARDPQFAELITAWADRREREVSCGARPQADLEMVSEARKCADDGARWRRAANEKWRKPGAA